MRIFQNFGSLVQLFGNVLLELIPFLVFFLFFIFLFGFLFHVMGAEIDAEDYQGLE
tara:strand:- start:469 stop:636 length:168 start_codon:yes stop_codon:yes gene_type:complete